MIAHCVAAPVLERVGARGRVAGVVRTAAYLDFDGFVVAVTARGVPLMPNGVGVTDRAEEPALGVAAPAAATSGAATQAAATLEWPAVGTAVRLTPGGLQGDGWRVAWAAGEPPLWNPTAPRANGHARAAIRARGEAILRGAAPTPEAFAGVEIARDSGGRAAISALLMAVQSGDPATAADGLLGRGPGLTPEGDDLLAGSAAAVHAFASWSPDAFAPPDAHTRTTALSATLLRLATLGQVVEPAGVLLDLDADPLPALARLERLGHSTGACYAAAIGATAALLGSRG